MTDTKAPPAPYMPFGVFTRTIEDLAESTVPSGPLDRRVLHGLSGVDYGSLISGLRFLGLVDEQRKATAAYRSLVQTSKDPQKFKALLLETINAAYKPVAGAVDVKHGTISELEKAFKDSGVSSGQMLTKTIRFYVKALTECGITVSPHIVKAKGLSRASGLKRNGTDKPRVRTKAITGRGASEEHPAITPAGFDRLPIPGVTGAFIQYPVGLSEADCTMFEAMLSALRTYVKGRLGGKEKKS